MTKRASGIILHISSLAGKYGIGDFGQAAYSFVDFLADAGQSYWQILPLGVTGFGDSPYQCFSAFAGNPYFIDLDDLINHGYLDKDTINKYKLYKDLDRVSYNLLYENKMELLRLAYRKSLESIGEELEEFMRYHGSWLREFSIFMTIKDKNNGKSWLEWEDRYKDASSKAIGEFKKENKDSIYFWVFTQYFFFKQWRRLKDYANENGVKIIGDLPIYVSIDSSDVWANTRFFNLDKALRPITISGVPGDAFAPEGQLWGNPIYDWEAMEKDDYKWWVNRIQYSFELYDSLRIDHFIGFESYWEVEYGSENAVHGKWTKGPGIRLFDKIREKLGELDIIAEDLGVVTDEVRKLIETTGFPGMKVLQFAFNPYEDSPYAIHNHCEQSVVYTGTHDSSTVLGWKNKASKEVLEYTSKYLNIGCDEEINWAFIRGAWSSTSYLAIAQMQDFLDLDDRARMNIPGTVGENWTWRMDPKQLDSDLSRRIKEITQLYRR